MPIPQTMTAWDRVFHLLKAAFPDSDYHCGKELRRVEQSDTSVSVDIGIYDEAGRPHLEITGLRCQLAPGTQRRARRLEDHLYEDRWQLQARHSPSAAEEATAGGEWLIFADQDIGEPLAAHLGERGGHAILVYPGEEYQ